ncbi:hypothetical protein [Candidatus Electronema sp. JM]|uniref:hypothetical protein n=1 Tax=Candidatus Electronema sp. JM TaxID=3401571 RepID=UPI003AA7F444
MAEPKAKTLQQRFGFMDTDMKKPKHDEIMLWLDSIVEERIASWIKHEPEWNSEIISDYQKVFSNSRQNLLLFLERRKGRIENDIKEFESLKEADKYSSYYESRYRESLEDLGLLKELHEKAARLEKLDPVPVKPSLSNIKKIWECPVKGYNDYIVGFIDLKVTYDYPELILAGISIPADLYRISGITWSPKWEVHTIQQGHYPCADPIYFEVKTEIPSLGELIRQINIYREYGAKKIFVVSPDDRYVSVLQEQGIGFIKYIPNK